MRGILIALCACGGAATGPMPTVKTPAKPRRVVDHRAPVDVVATLAQPLTEVSWIEPGPAQLELGGPSLQAMEGAPQLEVSVLEEQGNDVRVGVRLEHARFALWMSRERLLGIITRDVELSTGARATTSHVKVALRRGARVHTLARKTGRTQVRYIGALEVEGWLAEDSIADRARPTTRRFARVPTGAKQLMLTPGAVIRSEPRWAGAQLALVNQTHVVDIVKAVDDAWFEVSYADSDVEVHGYVSKRDPPARIHRKKPMENIGATPPNTSVRDGTCLHVRDEPIGFVVGDRPLLVEKSARAGWHLLTIDTPWGPSAFEVKGAVDGELAPCGE